MVRSFDGAYAIEATCHAPSRHGVYSEIYRVLKPGATFAMYEWCLTPQYDASNALHRRIKKQIEEGDGLPDMARTTEIDAAVSGTYLAFPLFVCVVRAANCWHAVELQYFLNSLIVNLRT